MAQEESLSYYEAVSGQDIIGMMYPLLKSSMYRLRNGDNKIIAEKGPSWDSPWHHVRHTFDLDCHTWNLIMFETVFKRRYVPSQCQNCYKTVIRPKTLLQLFALLEVLTQSGLPSKCGIEVRCTGEDAVPALYGGYVYSVGLEQGLEYWRIIREMVSEHEELGPDVPVILKRGCTEYERALGRSDKWEITDEQLHLEELVNRYVIRDTYHQPQSDHALAHVHKKWIEWAYAHGDETYLLFTDNRPLHPPYVTYHPEE